MHHILIIDDDTRILTLLKQFLSNHGYIVTAFTCVKEAEIFFNDCIFDLIVLDVMMPEVTGFEFSEKVKSLKNVPIILLTALNKVEDRIKGLESGADDYLSKPFEPKELLLRMKNLLELYSQYKTDNQICVFGDNSFNLITKKFKRGNKIIYLTSNEQKLLEFFIKNKNKILTRQDLLSVMGSLSPRSMDVQIVRLRAKIQDSAEQYKYLQTVRNVGYVFYI